MTDRSADPETVCRWCGQLLVRGPDTWRAQVGDDLCPVRVPPGLHEPDLGETGDGQTSRVSPPVR